MRARGGAEIILTLRPLWSRGDECCHVTGRRARCRDVRTRSELPRGFPASFLAPGEWKLLPRMRRTTRDNVTMCGRVAASLDPGGTRLLAISVCCRRLCATEDVCSGVAVVAVLGARLGLVCSLRYQE